MPLLSLSDAREDDLSLSWSGGMYTPVRLNKMDVSGSEIGRNTIGVCVCVCIRAMSEYTTSKVEPTYFAK